ncbi:hypothetical protein AB0L06_21165 [Spirillospora sp. NPDC052269]
MAERVAAAVSALPGVAGLATGCLPPVAGLQVGVPMSGVSVWDDAVEIGVVARFGRPLEELADDVRAVARPLAGDRRVDVLIADIADIVEDDETDADDATG